MTVRNDPSALRWLIGVELANHRKQAAITPQQVQEATGIARAKLSSMENGRYQQMPDDIVALLEFYGVPRHDIDRLTSLTGRGEGKTWWAPWSHIVPDWFKTFVGLEGLAAREFVFEPMVLPGLLQTEEYAQAITEATGFVRRDHSERFVSFRVARAKRLVEDEPLELHAVIGESALRLNVGTPEVRKRQYEHLMTLAKRPNVTVQVLRPEDGPHSSTTGKFVVLEFDRAQSIAYAERLDGAVYVQDPGDVGTYKMAVDNLRSVALSPQQSLVLVKGLINGS
ncbi:helix-turn-helix domain-containing protein [Saccharothrix coeruleofusca]|uniref:Transcriptional regulator n=1 Tax=Saccharothrix coeruleofusca TaxID=33919 RepID=A0A918AMZ1_9PSEU|nr:helix-turn-helix transcriptional regulator [Saccharothrix coeruleofusca]GGP59537.1 transcriptional regulator [Saccharothrix coeruleofusca]